MNGRETIKTFDFRLGATVMSFVDQIMPATLGAWMWHGLSCFCILLFLYLFLISTIHYGRTLGTVGDTTARSLVRSVHVSVKTGERDERHGADLSCIVRTL